ncbi:MAG: hypothetical protein BGO99_03680 [Nitrosospira sp. 56-18]|jgi:hypothetical protein|nr:hypothetical protein [Nitrosospira sp.]OJY09358.1 MAG: hypothetical protein BGO99_03680 [Nitrosospira sp. 56-18]
MKTKSFIAILVVLGFLTSCAQMNPHPMDMTSAIQNAKTSADHKALAKHYEDVARDMDAKVEEHKKLLNEYETHPYYGKRAQDLKAHCEVLIRSYKRAAEENMSMAKIHRQMAEEAK